MLWALAKDHDSVPAGRLPANTPGGYGGCQISVWQSRNCKRSPWLCLALTPPSPGGRGGVVYLAPDGDGLTPVAFLISGGLLPPSSLPCCGWLLRLFRWAVDREGRQQFRALRSREVFRQMGECQTDHVAVVRLVFARLAGQVEPEAMDQIDIGIAELRGMGA